MSLQREILSPVTTNLDDEPKHLYVSNYIYLVRVSRDVVSSFTPTNNSGCDAEYGGERITVNISTVQCLICKKEFKGITNTHLKNHGLTLEEYELQFPNSKQWHSNRKPWNKGLSANNDERIKNNIDSSRNTILKKYGVDNIAKVPEFMEKMVKTRIKTDNYGIGIPKLGTSIKLKNKPKSPSHCKHISQAAKRSYQVNPKRREACKKRGTETMSKLMSRKQFVSFPQRTMFAILKKYFPDAILEYKVKVNKNHNRFLDVAIPSLKLDFEYDGFIHTYLTTKENDNKRDKELNNLGWKTIRINKVLLKNLERYLLLNQLFR